MVFRQINFQNAIQYIVHLLFYFLSIRIIFVYLYHAPPYLHFIASIAVVSLACLIWKYPRAVIYGFIAFIPCISGIQLIAGGIEKFSFLEKTPLLSIGFAIIYVVWITRIVFYNQIKRIQKTTFTGILTEVLAAIVLLSLIFDLSGYPFNVIIKNIFIVPFAGQEDTFWSIQAAYIILQGIFIFRIIEYEIYSNNEIQIPKKIFIFHAVTISIFSLLQILWQIPEMDERVLHAPFDDLHSYGSYIVLMFFVLFGFTIGSKSIILAMLSLLMLAFVFLSSSVTSLLALIVAFAGFLVFKMRLFKSVLICGALVAVILTSGVIPTLLHKSEHPVLRRYAERLSVDHGIKKLQGRFLSADQAFGMIKQHPTTGVGVGTYYRVARYYHFSDEPHPYRIENAHNYYLQFAAELGLPAFILFIGIMIHAINTGWIAIKYDSRQKNESFGIVFGIIAYLITLVTGHPLLLSNQQFLFWFGIASLTSIYLIIGRDNENIRRVVDEKKKSLLYAVLAVAVIGYAYSTFDAENMTAGYEYGYYETENINDKPMRWTQKETCKVIQAKTDIIGFNFYLPPEYVKNGEKYLELSINDKVIDQIHVKTGGFQYYYFQIQGIKGKLISAKTVVNQTINPYKLKMTGDIKKNREQGIAMGDIIFLRIPPKHILKNVQI